LTDIHDADISRLAHIALEVDKNPVFVKENIDLSFENIRATIKLRGKRVSFLPGAEKGAYRSF
jgi:hypothetical protein